MTRLVLVAAIGRDRAIGRGNALLFRDPQDGRHLRELTMGHPVVMGRRTWESLPERFRPLPGRRNVVLSRDDTFVPPGAERAASLDDALLRLATADRVFVLGGGDVYVQALPRADELWLTEIDRTYPDADSHFPAWNRAEFDEVSRRDLKAADGTAFAIVNYRRHR